MQPVVTISIDAMGGDDAPGAIIGGVAKALRGDPQIKVILHGDVAVLRPELQRRRLSEDDIVLQHSDDVVGMADKPSHAVRRGRKSSMWATLQSVRDGHASAAVSAGNTGALMAMALFCLDRAEGVNRPAIAALWPSTAPHENCVMLDMGADIRADASDLISYAILGAEYARVAFGVSRPRVGVLNIGTEPMKGRAEERDAAETLKRFATDPESNIEFVGFVEANAILHDTADVIVTDGYTGNIALKAAEGTARFISDHLRGAFSRTLRGRVAALLGMPSLRSLKQRIDPRRINGGVFLGLDGLVVKSHGSTDATGFAAALSLAARMARSDFGENLAPALEKSLHALVHPSNDQSKVENPSAMGWE